MTRDTERRFMGVGAFDDHQSVPTDQPAPAPDRREGLREAIRLGLDDSTADAKDGHTLMSVDVVERIAERILAAIASPSEEPGQDVERLAQALHDTYGPHFPVPGDGTPESLRGGPRPDPVVTHECPTCGDVHLPLTATERSVR